MILPLINNPLKFLLPVFFNTGIVIESYSATDHRALKGVRVLTIQWLHTVVFCMLGYCAQKFLGLEYLLYADTSTHVP